MVIRDASSVELAFEQVNATRRNFLTLM